MKRIFDVQDDDLDLAADPNRVVEVQSLVRDLLQGDEARALGVKEEIEQKHKAFALPGLISATYTMQDHLRAEHARNELASLIAAVSKDNSELHRFIIEKGIIEAPFNTSRLVCEAALDLISNVECAPSDISNLRAAVQRENKDQNVDGVVILLGAWLKLAPETAYGEAMRIVDAWLGRPSGVPSQVFELANKCIQHYPEQTAATLERLLSHLARDDKGAIAPLSENLRFNQQSILAVLPAVDRLVRQQRTVARPHEAVIRYGIGRYLKQHPEALSQLENQARQCGTQTRKYWWMAVSFAGEQNPDIRQYLLKSIVEPANDTFFDGAALQLVFLYRKRSGAPAWVREFYPKAAHAQPDRMERAEEAYERIIDGAQRRIYKDGDYVKSSGPGELGEKKS